MSPFSAGCGPSQCRATLTRLAQLLDPVDVAVICSWVSRAVLDCPDQAVYVAV